MKVSSASSPDRALRVRVDHERRAGLHLRRRDGLEDHRHVDHDPVALDRALQEPGPDPGVVDPLAQLADEQRGELVARAVAQDPGQLRERVEPRAHDHVELGHLLVHACHAAHVATEAERRRIHERAVARVDDGAELRHRVGDPRRLVPDRLAPGVVEVGEPLLVGDEEVLVHEGAAERVELDRAPHRLDGHHFLSRPPWRARSE